MATGVTRIEDVIVPEIFTPYVQTVTQQKSALIQSGAAIVDPMLSSLLLGGGLTFNQPFYNDLDDDDENVSSDDPAVNSTPNKISTGREVQVRLSRNNSWSSMSLNAALMGDDPMEAIADRVGAYWARRLQSAFIATMTGVFADNAAAPAGDDTHTQDDMTVDLNVAGYAAGASEFSAEAFVDAAGTMGDSMGNLSMVAMHSVVYQRAIKNNLIDFIPDARGEYNISTFLGRQVIVDDAMPNNEGVFETWLFGANAIALGIGSPNVPTETFRKPDSGNGGGQDTLHNRVEWCVHPVGYAYVGAPPDGGPSNADTANNLANADSWSRRFAERKQVNIARLITVEF